MTASYLRQLYGLIPLCALCWLLLSWGMPLWMIMICLLVAASTLWLLPAQVQPERIRFTAEAVTLWRGQHSQRWQWTGEGRLSHAFVELRLTREDLVLRLRIWRDSVSNSSWRALRMAYRVNRAVIQSSPPAVAN